MNLTIDHKMTFVKIVLSILAVSLFFLAISGIYDNKLEKRLGGELMNGVSIVAPANEFDENPFSPVKLLNANWIAVMPYAFTDGEKPEVIYDHSKQWWGERSSGLTGVQT